jgi:hypothetical protein
MRKEACTAVIVLAFLLCQLVLRGRSMPLCVAFATCTSAPGRTAAGSMCTAQIRYATVRVVRNVMS